MTMNSGVEDELRRSNFAPMLILKFMVSDTVTDLRLHQVINTTYKNLLGRP
jgi:hypothetical protein